MAKVNLKEIFKNYKVKSKLDNQEELNKAWNALFQTKSASSIKDILNTLYENNKPEEIFFFLNQAILNAHYFISHTIIKLEGVAKNPYMQNIIIDIFWKVKHYSDQKNYQSLGEDIKFYDKNKVEVLRSIFKDFDQNGIIPTHITLRTIENNIYNSSTDKFEGSENIEKFTHIIGEVLEEKDPGL